jgi:hypothetical protein
MTVRLPRHLAMGLAGTVAACALGAGVGTRVSSAKLPSATGAAPARLLVYAQEWSLWPSRGSLPRGSLIAQLWNRGQDAHDLRIRRLDRRGRMTGRAQGVTVTQSGKLGQASWRLGPGRYQLYCSMPGHLKLGMHARLRVR